MKINKAFIFGFVCGIVFYIAAAKIPFDSFFTQTFESQVRTWASDYPDDLRNKWAWCYLDSAENWSTDQKLREDVRLKSVQVLTDSERQTLMPLDVMIKTEVPQQETPLKEVYHKVGIGLKTAEWTPPEPIPKPEVVKPDNETPKPPIRRRFFNRRQ
jgi:hypothetical protein